MKFNRLGKERFYITAKFTGVERDIIKTLAAAEERTPASYVRGIFRQYFEAVDGESPP